MCKKNLTIPFKFFCYTDDVTDLNDEVNIIPFVDHKLEIIVHNKLFLFSRFVDQYLTDGPRLYFDVDLIIKRNINFLLHCNKKELTLIRASWKKEYKRGLPIFHHMFNSSCMLWEAPYTRNIWEHFIKDPELYTLIYHWGMDSFLSYEHEKIKSKIHFFPERIFMSLQYGGIDFHEQQYYLNKYNKNFGSMHPHIKNNISIVLLNGDDTENQYPNFKIYYTN